jgi:hypothetical protein
MHLNTLKMLSTYHKCLLLICGSIQGVQNLLPRGPKHQTMDDHKLPRLQKNINFGPYKHPQEKVFVDHNFLRSGATNFNLGTLPSSQILFFHDEVKQVIKKLVLQGKDFKVHLDLKVLPLQSWQCPDGWRFHTQPVITLDLGDPKPSHEILSTRKKNCKDSSHEVATNTRGSVGTSSYTMPEVIFTKDLTSVITNLQMTNYENLPHRVMASAKLECVACLQGGNQNIAMSLDSVEADLLDNLNKRKVISCTACNIYI